MGLNVEWIKAMPRHPFDSQLKLKREDSGRGHEEAGGAQRPESYNSVFTRPSINKSIDFMMLQLITSVVPLV